MHIGVGSSSATTAVSGMVVVLDQVPIAAAPAKRAAAAAAALERLAQWAPNDEYGAAYGVSMGWNMPGPRGGSRFVVGSVRLGWVCGNGIQPERLSANATSRCVGPNLGSKKRFKSGGAAAEGASQSWAWGHPTRAS
ncbi:hypothetical protein PG994_008339 [Apiospora phragmitis]|uniref:Uncharacterized protein n=1 Tax=Apiospora phragmitis TaxID=2905665 RepID=A0ABR1USS0_9PEZI